VDNDKILVKFENVSPRFWPLYRKTTTPSATGQDRMVVAPASTPQEKIVATLQI
jgi:hypothetical protein